MNASQPAIGTMNPLTPPSNGSWSNPLWVYDPQNSSGNANNANPGSLIAPVRDFSAILQRWGTLTPILRQATRILALSSHTDNSDPVIFTPYASGAASYVSVEGGPATVIATGRVLSGVIAKNRTAGANTPPMTANLGAGAARGMIVSNTTAGKISQAMVYKLVSGTTWILSQPVVPPVVTALPFPPTQVDTWANNDTFDLLQPVAINLVTASPRYLDGQGSGPFPNFPSGVFANATIFSPAGELNDYAQIGPMMRLYNGYSQRGLLFAGDGAVAVGIVFGPACVNFGMITIMGAALTTPIIRAGFAAPQFGMFIGSAYFDSDFILGGACTFEAKTLAEVGTIYLDATLTSYSTITKDPGAKLYGSTLGQLNMLGTARFSSNGDAYVTTMTAPNFIATGINVNGAPTANSFAAGVITPGIATTPANIDAAAGVAGFGGLAFNLGGASLAKST